MNMSPLLLLNIWQPFISNMSNMTSTVGFIYFSVSSKNFLSFSGFSESNKDLLELVGDAFKTLKKSKAVIRSLIAFSAQLYLYLDEETISSSPSVNLIPSIICQFLISPIPLLPLTLLPL
jgi:hypothetical protein